MENFGQFFAKVLPLSRCIIFIVDKYNLQVDKRTLKRKSDNVDKGCKEKVSLIKMKPTVSFMNKEL